MTHQITSPFFKTPVSVSGERREGDRLRRFGGTVFSVCVDDGDSDISDAVTQKTIRQRSFFIRRSDWFERTPPQAGDVVTTEHGDRFAVERVSELQILGWSLAAREI